METNKLSDYYWTVKQFGANIGGADLIATQSEPRLENVQKQVSTREHVVAKGDSEAHTDLAHLFVFATLVCVGIVRRTPTALF